MTCIPAQSLLSPLKKSICPLSSERFELRTPLFGCACSTITFLSIMVTIFATLLATLLFYGIWRSGALQWIWRIFAAGKGEGWERVEHEDGSVTEGNWRRGGSVNAGWGFKLFTGLGDDEAMLEERRRLIGG